jgi:hypothetical protein
VVGAGLVVVEWACVDQKGRAQSNILNGIILKCVFIGVEVGRKGILQTGVVDVGVLQRLRLKV